MNVIRPWAKTWHTTYLINKGTQENIKVSILGIVASRIMIECLNRQTVPLDTTKHYTNKIIIWHFVIYKFHFTYC